MSETRAPERPGRFRLPRRVLTWLIMALLFFLLFRLVPTEDVLAELGKMDMTRLRALMGLALLAISVVAVIDGAAMWYGFSLFKVPLKLRETIMIRAAMMLLASIATLIGQAGLAAHVSRRYRIDPGKAAGMVLFLFMIEVYGLITASTIGLFLLFLWPGGQVTGDAPLPLAAGLMTLAWLALLLVFLWGKKYRPAGFLERIKLAAVLEPLRLVSPGQFARLLAMKTLLASWQLAVTWLAFKIFRLEVPALELFAFMPLAIIVSSIPITPARLGTTQWSWKLFFDYGAPAAALVAMSLLLQFLLNVARWMVGALALTLVYKEIFGKYRESAADADGSGLK